ncbi:MAG: fatty acid desaturase [Gemmobacter sp.]
MDHRTFLAGLDPGARAALTRRSDARGVGRLASHLGAIGVCGTLIAVGVPFWGLLLPVQGVLIVFLFTLEHEATHKTPFASGWLNEAAGHGAGILIALPFTWFRYFHLAHHRWTNLDGQDPELEGAKPETVRDWVVHVSGWPYWRSQAMLLVRLARGRERPAFLPEAARARAGTEARVMILVYAGVAAGLIWSPLLVWVWLLPVVLGQPFLRLYLLAEHGDCPRVADMFLNTRTTFTTALVRWLAWNMPYHTEHHVAPLVPFHALPALHARMRGHLRVTERGYARFTRGYLARRLRTGSGVVPPVPKE